MPFVELGLWYWIAFLDAPKKSTKSHQKLSLL